MKTTVEISDSLFKEVKRYAAERGITFREVLEASLRENLTHSTRRKKPFKLRDASVKGRAMLITDWDRIKELMYEGRGA